MEHILSPTYYYNKHQREPWEQTNSHQKHCRKVVPLGGRWHFLIQHKACMGLPMGTSFRGKWQSEAKAGIYCTYITRADTRQFNKPHNWSAGLSLYSLWCLLQCLGVGLFKNADNGTKISGTSCRSKRKKCQRWKGLSCEAPMKGKNLSWELQLTASEATACAVKQNRSLSPWHNCVSVMSHQANTRH